MAGGSVALYHETTVRKSAFDESRFIVSVRVGEAFSIFIIHDTQKLLRSLQDYSNSPISLDEKELRRRKACDAVLSALKNRKRFA